MSKYIHKSHNVSVLLYHFVYPVKYSKVIFDKEVDETLKVVCPEISKRYEINLPKIGIDKDHVHFLIQSVPKYSVTQIIKNNKEYHCQKDICKTSTSKRRIMGF